MFSMKQTFMQWKKGGKALNAMAFDGIFWKIKENN